MTITYSKEVTTSKGIGIFLKLLLRWKGSIYKMVWADLLLYLVIYYVLNLLYLYGLGEKYQKYFIIIVTYFSKYGSAIPLSFVLGFYINVIYNRWWSQFTTIPYPDNIAILVGASIHGKDEKSKIIRRTIIRYVCVAFTMTLSMISPKVKKRFPTFHHFVQAGLLTYEEKRMVEELDKEYQTYSAKYWLPLAWAANVTTCARKEGIIKDDLGLKDILQQINSFREKCKQLSDYDWVCVPLVYTQVVTLAVYLYFLFDVIGTQFVEEQADFFFFRFPLMSCVQFFFYMGWLKVAESLINPFGEDDDDFEVVWMIDRHLQVGYLLVDRIHNEHPKLTKDYHWAQGAPTQLPFTVASQKYMDEHPVESTCEITVNKSDQDLIFRDDMRDLQEPGLLLNPGGVRRRLGGLFSRSRSHPGYQLKRISLQAFEKEIEERELQEKEGSEWSGYNEFVGDQPAKSNEHQPNNEAFEALRQQRLTKRKEDLIKMLEILSSDRDRARTILDEILK